MKRKQRIFTVILDIPLEATEEDCRTYIEDWVKSGRGSLEPPCSYGEDTLGHPMWDLDPSTVIVRTGR